MAEDEPAAAVAGGAAEFIGALPLVPGVVVALPDVAPDVPGDVAVVPGVVADFPGGVAVVLPAV